MVPFNILLKVGNVYFIILLLSFFKEDLLCIWTNLNCVFPRMLCAKFDWNSVSDSEEKVKKLIGNKFVITSPRKDL